MYDRSKSGTTPLLVLLTLLLLSALPLLLTLSALLLLLLLGERSHHQPQGKPPAGTYATLSCINRHLTLIAVLMCLPAILQDNSDIQLAALIFVHIV